MHLSVQVPYRLFPYEERFLRNEIEALGGALRNGGPSSLSATFRSMSEARLLTYARSVRNGGPEEYTVQALREGTTSRGQQTRYGPHALHEYKGRFNPQTPRSLAIQHLRKAYSGLPVLDPFAGSGTTLVELRALGFSAIGMEMNPLAHFIAEAKIAWEEPPHVAPPQAADVGATVPATLDESVLDYLLRWFPAETLTDVFRVVTLTSGWPEADRKVGLALCSNLLRTYSWQEPADLRIRRRSRIPPMPAFAAAWTEAVKEHWLRRRAWHEQHHPFSAGDARVILGDSRRLSHTLPRGSVEGTISSPPYATALPYVDTYRLSLAVLGLASPRHLLMLERSIIGARDVSAADRRVFSARVRQLPESCREIVNSIADSLEGDSAAGFRKRALPFALARYLADMRDVMRELHVVEREGARNCWVVGPNRTTIGSREIQIPTPVLLGDLALQAGFRDVSYEQLDAYGRYDLHAKNSIRSETLVTFNA